METTLRTKRDRLRHTLLFEVFLVVLLMPLLSILLNQPMHTMGAITLTLSLVAMTFNYIYNYAFDHALLRLGRPVYQRGPALRVIHALLFEVLLFFFTAPLVMYVLNYTLLQAFLLDLGFVIMVPIYAFFFNMAYDRFFPVPIATTN